MNRRASGKKGKASQSPRSPTWLKRESWGRVRKVCDGPYTAAGTYELAELTAVTYLLTVPSYVTQKAYTLIFGTIREVRVTLFENILYIPL